MSHSGRGLRLVTEPARHPSAGGQRVLVVEHPIVAHRLSYLRAAETDNATFRTVMGELSAVVAYEALRDLRTAEQRVDTPMARDVVCQRVSEMVLLVPILRAGLGMIPAIQEMLPLTEVAHVGLRRDEETLVPSVYLERLPRDLSGRRVIICDPMLATGGSLVKVCDLVKQRGATEISALCVIASRPGLDHFCAHHPSVKVACVAVDEELNEQGFIVPGLGDAGDRLFGPPA
ncbi:MAG: uracil phosphoribosyltransferase [Acidimicrobiales bacterium]